jgi:hypothetical protein
MLSRFSVHVPRCLARFLHGHPRVVVSLLVSCALAALVGTAIEVAAWIKATSNARRLSDQTWHRRLERWGIVGGALTPFLGSAQSSAER